MSKAVVTKELSEKIKRTRINNKIKAKDLAAHIEKSPAYVSKLENYNIKTIDYDDLLKIFNFISKKNTDFDQIIDNLSLELSSEELERQAWLMNFDTVERKIPVPANLIDFINEKVRELKIDISYLVDYINKNNDLSDIISKYNIILDNYEKNLWYCEYYENKSVLFIILKMDIEKVTALLEKKEDTANYVAIQGILYNLFRLEHEENDVLVEEKNNKIKEEVLKKLNFFKFYSILERKKAIESAVTEQELESLLNEFDLSNRKLINEFLEYIVFLSEFNVKYTNEKLKLLNLNYSWDPSYMLAISALPFHNLKNMSNSLKKDLLNDIDKLTKKYIDKPEVEKVLETY